MLLLVTDSKIVIYRLILVIFLVINFSFSTSEQMNSSKEVNLSIKEHLLTSATDMVECLRMNPSKVILLKFYLGNTEDSLMLNQSNKFWEFLGGNGNFLPLIDALDGSHNESVNTKVLQVIHNESFC